MPFEMIVQSAFTERLEGGAMRVRLAGDHIRNPDEIDALRGHRNVVQVWVDDPPPKPAVTAKPDPIVTTDPAIVPIKA